MLRLFFLLSLMISGCMTAAKRERLSPQGKYELGLKYMRRGMYQKAIEQFTNVRNFHRDDPLSVKSELAIADVYYKKREWPSARQYYDEFARMHPRHADLDYVNYRIGMASYKTASKYVGRDQTQTMNAVRAWTGFSSRFPESHYLPDVEKKLKQCRERLAMKEIWIARFYKRRHAWKAVLRRSDGVLYDYQDSRHLPKAVKLFGEASAWEGREDEAKGAVVRLEKDDPKGAEKLSKKVARIKEKLERRNK